jgi:hypothetical protein
MQTVGVDLSQVPIDEVISFKQQNDTLYKSYRKSVKAMIHDIGESSSVERSNEMLGQRKEEIEEIANSIRKISLSTWGSVIGFSLGALGAAWTVTHGQDSIQGILDFGGLIASGLSVAGDNTGAYSYLFKAKGKLNYY